MSNKAPTFANSPKSHAIRHFTRWVSEPAFNDNSNRHGRTVGDQDNLERVFGRQPRFDRGTATGHRQIQLYPTMLVVLLFAVFLNGCSMYQTGYHNLVVAPLQFPFHRDRRATEKYHRQLAQEALAELQESRPGTPFSADYIAGYQAGVIDYLTNGGVPTPPLLPPRNYWKISYRAENEHEAAQQWLSGASDGREHAVASGLRDFAVVPSSLFINGGSEGMSISSHSDGRPSAHPHAQARSRTPDMTGRVSLKRNSESELR